MFLSFRCRSANEENWVAVMNIQCITLFEIKNYLNDIFFLNLLISLIDTNRMIEIDIKR